MMNLTSALPTATRGVFSENIVIAYLPSGADGFHVSIINRHTWRVKVDRDRLHKLVGISSKYHHLIIVEDIFLSHILEERKEIRL